MKLSSHFDYKYADDITLRICAPSVCWYVTYGGRVPVWGRLMSDSETGMTKTDNCTIEPAGFLTRDLTAGGFLLAWLRLRASWKPSNVIVGTAGHIDHGKSSLVEALTGTNPDRLEEEKRQGITLDLGLRFWSLRAYGWAWWMCRGTSGSCATCWRGGRD